MPRSRSPDVEAAEKMYREGMLLKDIAAKFKVPEGTVRSWKSRGDWDKTPDKKNECNVANKNATNATLQKRKRGGQPGNQNGKGHGAPKGNHNNYKHGAYSMRRWDFLDDEEKELVEDIPDDAEEILIESIKMYTIRERKIMKAIARYETSNDDVALQTEFRNEQLRTFDGTPEEQIEQEEEYKRRIQKKVDADERLPGRSYTKSTQVENKDNLIARLQQELTTVQRAKDRAAQMLEQIRNERRKMQTESSGDDIVNDWISAVLMEGGPEGE